MENLFEIVSKIELKKYSISLDKYDIQAFTNCALEYINDELAYKNYLLNAVLIQVLQKIEAKKRLIQNLKPKSKLKFNLTPVEFLAMERLVKISFEKMPMLHCILEQLDNQKS